MKVRKCLLLEDSEVAAAILKHSIAEMGLYTLLHVRTVEEAKAVLAAGGFDLLFVDIELGEGCGLNFLRSNIGLPPTIVVTSHPEYAVDAYDIEVIADFLPKPYTSGRLRRAINRAIGTIYQENAIIEKDFAFLQSGRKVVKYAYKDIDYIQAYGVYSKLYKDGAYSLVNESISDLETSLPGNTFRRVHKSYVLNLHKITSYDHKLFYLNSSEVPIGITYRESLKYLLRIFGAASPQ